MKLVTTKVALLVLAAAQFVACSKSSDSAASTAATTMALSGSMAVTSRAGEPAEMSVTEYIKNEAITALATFSARGTGDGVSSQAAACGDGNYYRVLCSAWSVPPVSAYGDVSCSGSTGSFTVSGLPLKTDLSCAVRKSSDGNTFKPFANLELPASSISGTTDNINSTGDMAISVTVNTTTGAATATVTSGSNSTGTTTAAVDATGMTGYYNLTCPADISDANSIQCKCFLFGDDPDTCISNSASSVTTTSMTINFNVYEATATGDVNLNDDSAVEVTTGGKVYAGTVWGAGNSGNACTSSASCASLRTGDGEGLPAITNLTWTNTAAAAALTWSTSVEFNCPTAGDADGTADGKVTIAIGTVPGSSANRSDWLTWLQDIVNAYDNPGKCTSAWNGCGEAANSRHTNPHCVGNFAWQILDDASRTGANLPRLQWDWSSSQTCNSSGCTTSAIAANMLQVEDVDFNGTTGATEHYGPSPRNRFVFDQFLPNSAGTGGSLKDNNFRTEYYHCSDSSIVCSDDAETASAGLECATKKDMVIKFIPTSTAGAFNMVFNETTGVAFGKYRGGSVDGTDAYAACVTKLASSGTTPAFMARATKL